MKNYFITLSFLLTSLFTSAQSYDYGSMIAFPDGSLGIVFYLDDSGEHGLAFSCETKYTAKYVERKKEEAKKFNKKAKKYGTPLIDYSLMDKDILPQATEEISNKELINTYKEIIPNLSDDGEKNMAVITEYCEKNGVSMQNYFPEHYWAKNIGEGWYIPGNKELELIAKILIGGTGENYYVKDALALTNRGVEFNMITITTPLSIERDVNMLASIKSYCRGIQSSTMKDAKKGFYSLISVCNSKKGYREWLELQETETGEAQIISVRKF